MTDPMVRVKFSSVKKVIATIEELKAVLREHHKWHQQDGLEMKLGDKYFDCASCYVDSTLEERTMKALKS